MKKLLKSPSAWLPIAMSAAALLWLTGFIVLGIREPEGDEGTGAHVFQLLMGGQVLVILFFLIKWLPQKPKPTLQILPLQVIAALIPFAVLYFFEH